MFSNLILKFHLVWKSHGFKYIHIYINIFFLHEGTEAQGLFTNWLAKFTQYRFVLMARFFSPFHYSQEVRGRKAQIWRPFRTPFTKWQHEREGIFWGTGSRLCVDLRGGDISVHRCKMSSIWTLKICALVRKLSLNFKIRNHPMIGG